jgi:putative transposase
MKIMVADSFLEKGIPKRQVLQALGIPRSSYYYTPTGNKAGKRPKVTIQDKHGHAKAEDVVINDIKRLLENEFVDYGYYKTYRYLKDELGYQIGSTRTYRVMKKNGLLKFQRDKTKRSNRNWVKDLVPIVHTEFSFLEFDIKYVYIQGKRTNAQVLTVLDVFTRWNLGHYIAYSIKSEDVIGLFEQLFAQYELPKCFIVRNDNGSQFEAAVVQKYLQDKGVTQEFTKPSTPQQNAHIESYHSIMESAVCQRFEFLDLKDFKDTMTRWQKFYNFDRIHGGIGYKSPYSFLLEKGVDMKLKNLN